MPRPNAPFQLDGASIYPEERSVLSNIIQVIYDANPSRDERLTLNHAEQTFRQIMFVKDGRWSRRRVFNIGPNGDGPSVLVSDQ